MATKQSTTTKSSQPSRSIRPRTRRISLAFMGPDFTDCYVDMRYATWDDSQRMEQEISARQTNEQAHKGIVATLQQLFFAGRIVDLNGELIEMEAADIAAFDLMSVSELFQLSMGVSDPKAPEPASDAPSEESFHEPTFAEEQAAAEAARAFTSASKG